VGHSYALPVIKLLFATARTCAYPDCAIPLVFIDEDRDVREVAVQIAHIRSPRPHGPRHDPDFPRDKLNSDVNLLLLCGVHHHPVDRNDSKYSTEELLAWKRAQTAEGGGFTVQDSEVSDLAARLESMIGELVQATRLHLQARIVGGRLVSPNPPRVICLPLEALNDPGHEAAAPFLPGRLIGVEVENHGPVGAEVRAAGIDVDYAPAEPESWPYSFIPNNLTPWQFPCRVDGHSTRDWFDSEHQIRRSLARRFTTYGVIPRRFRAWAAIGNGDLLFGDWIPRAELPIWDPGTGETELQVLFRESALAAGLESFTSSRHSQVRPGPGRLHTRLPTGRHHYRDDNSGDGRDGSEDGGERDDGAALTRTCSASRGDEVNALINAGRITGVGPDKRLRR
jgi:hypothetical protein